MPAPGLEPKDGAKRKVADGTEEQGPDAKKKRNPQVEKNFGINLELFSKCLSIVHQMRCRSQTDSYMFRSPEMILNFCV